MELSPVFEPELIVLQTTELFSLVTLVLFGSLWLSRPVWADANEVEKTKAKARKGRTENIFFIFFIYHTSLSSWLLRLHRNLGYFGFNFSLKENTFGRA